jgi:hypothetical protein
MNEKEIKMKIKMAEIVKVEETDVKEIVEIIKNKFPNKRLSNMEVWDVIVQYLGNRATHRLLTELGSKAIQSLKTDEWVVTPS